MAEEVGLGQLGECEIGDRHEDEDGKEEEWQRSEAEQVRGRRVRDQETNEDDGKCRS